MESGFSRENGRNNRSGISFIEIIISLMLLSIAIGAVIGAFLIGRVAAARAKHRISAVNIARAKIEAVKAATFSQVPSQAGTASVAIDTGLTGQLTTTVSDVKGDAKLYKVNAGVTWKERDVSQTLKEEVITLISQR